ncbi:MAG: MBL fold metallo-hydrolase [Bacteroidetes Order II. Incertae sedis bacterium]|jgi:hydroxyacylglutathione hydrolase|nr:MBL fold metallo-hydrolase [Bacteroidetes Order II. bacterium]MBT4053193.1 MBL fold metallo-hydrolase [Bacteroidetes Order II. bacterium]MBT4601979.1 MBL fold metallo-hydrolase [Bacteroidetes Order II. bacterium]MBT5250836.1 MBL fold metallo-hydrolase [Bacteroidetes Order II. bacterium]MBT6199653.1 MBL fold metallo-hydrolase [Bacteroidetes Order II. bacterium]
MLFRQIWDQKLAQYAYLIGCQATGEAIIVDPERDIDVYLELAEKEGLEITAVADTHIHADYLSGAREFAERGVKVYASDEGDADWKYEWLIGSDYNYQLVLDKDEFMIGNIKLTVVHSPGHTPEHIAFLVTDMGGGADRPMGILTGDFVFVGDLGRPDLLESAAGVVGVMEPSARTLYKSVQDFLELDDFLQVWPAHGAGSACGKALGAVPMSTVGYEREFNAAIDSAKRSEDEFVAAILDGQPEPPMYFARMKRDNKIGPKVLGSLPQPKHLFVDDLKALSGNTDVAVLDTRLDRSAFMARHLPGSLYAGFNKSFNSAAGSIIEEDMDIYLIIEADQVEEAVRDLIRIGLDNIKGYATPATLEAYAEAHGEMASIREINIKDVASVVENENDVVVLDVRNKAEHDAAYIPDSANIAYTRMWVRRDEVPSGTKAIHCVSGGRAAVSTALLARLGHNVIFINGEFEEWSASEGAVVAHGEPMHA